MNQPPASTWSCGTPLWDFVREINQQGTTILLTTHYLEEAEQMCDRIAIMNHGNLVALEATGTLLQQLGTRSLLVHLEDPVSSLPHDLCCQDAVILNDGMTLQLSLSADQTTGRLLKSLCDLGLAIHDVETRQASLEDVFLQMTREKGAPP